jgi:hypothetical protein
MHFKKGKKKACVYHTGFKNLLNIGKRPLRKIKAGIVLLSHSVAAALPSPQAGLTSEFGMGSGVSPPL